MAPGHLCFKNRYKRSSCRLLIIVHRYRRNLDSLQNVNLGAAAPTQAWQAVTSNTTGGRDENPFNRRERRDVNLGAAAPTQAWQAVTSNTTGGR
jgi:hypothetical protein